MKAKVKLNPLITLPRECAQELLIKSGLNYTPEQYLKSNLVSYKLSFYKKYLNRSKVAYWSAAFLGLVACLSWISVLVSFSFFNLVFTVLLSIITYFEFTVYKLFQSANPKAPKVGFSNQLGFVVFIIDYCIYVVLSTPDFSLVKDELPVGTIADLNTITTITRLSYVLLAIVGAVSQLSLAWYYKLAPTQKSI